MTIDNDGYIEFKGVEDDICDEIAIALDEEPELVKETVEQLKDMGLIEMLEEDFFLPEAKGGVGSECDSAERVRKCRANKKMLQRNNKVTESNEEVTNCNTQVTQRREKENREEKEEIKREIEQESISLCSRITLVVIELIMTDHLYILTLIIFVRCSMKSVNHLSLLLILKNIQILIQVFLLIVQ